VGYITVIDLFFFGGLPDGHRFILFGGLPDSQCVPLKLTS